MKFYVLQKRDGTISRPVMFPSNEPIEESVVKDSKSRDVILMVLKNRVFIGKT